MTSWGCARAAVDVTTAGEARRRRGRRGRTALALFVVGWAALSAPAAGVRAGDPTGPGTKPDEAPAIILEIPHPALAIDRLTDPRVQHALELSQTYRQFREGPQFRQVQAVVNLIAGQLHMSWDRALRELTGGGIVARVSAEPGREPRVEAIVTSRDPKLLERLNEIFLNLARQDARSKNGPDPVRTTDYRGTAVHVVGPDGKLAYALVSGRLAIASPSQDIERLVDRVRAKDPIAAPSAAGSDGDVVLRGHIDLQRLRKLDPKKYVLPDKPNPGIVFLFGSWYDALNRAAAIDATLRWSEDALAADVDLPLPGGARPATVKGYLPEPGHGAMPPLRPPGTIASLSLWRDWATIWESRAELFRPEVVQGFAQLDTVAGQFFGAREFGPDVLGSFDPHWRLVIAQQDYAALKPAPDLKLPAFAIVAILNGSQEDFAARLKIGFQSLVSISNVESAQKKGPVLELGSEVVDGVTIATTRYLVSRQAPSASEPGAQRYNFSPSTAQVGPYFVLSSGAGLARALVKELKAIEASGRKPADQPATFTAEGDGAELVRLLDQNRSRMVMQAMLGRGETKPDAEARIGKILDLFRYLGHGRLVVTDAADRTHLQLKLDLAR